MKMQLPESKLAAYLALRDRGDELGAFWIVLEHVSTEMNPEYDWRITKEMIETSLAGGSLNN
jgi:hypothetical protein